MSRVAVVVAAAVAVAVAGCRQQTTHGDEVQLLSVFGTVSDVQERSLQVRTDDGRVLDFALDDAVAVTLGGGESQRAVITEGAPVRVAYRPRGGDAELVSIDVEPMSPAAKGIPPVPSPPIPPADPGAAAQGGEEAESRGGQR